MKKKDLQGFDFASYYMDNQEDDDDDDTAYAEKHQYKCLHHHISNF